jgi:hypothetical protein
MKYAVHLYPSVQVKVVDIEADSFEEAIAKAESIVNLHQVLDNHHPMAANVENVQWDEGEYKFVQVDLLGENGEVTDEETIWLDSEGNPLVCGKTMIERNSQGLIDANLFMQELLDSVEGLVGISNEYGTLSLVDIIYLHSAILNGSFIDSYSEQSSVMHIATSLPSGERWGRFIKDKSDDEQSGSDPCKQAITGANFEEKLKSGYIASSGWTHIFVGDRKELTRWVYDCSNKDLLCAQVIAGKRWITLDQSLMGDLLESIHDSDIHKNPEDFDLVHFETLPSWVRGML